MVMAMVSLDNHVTIVVMWINNRTSNHVMDVVNYWKMVSMNNWSYCNVSTPECMASAMLDAKISTHKTIVYNRSANMSVVDDVMSTMISTTY